MAEFFVCLRYVPATYTRRLSATEGCLNCAKCLRWSPSVYVSNFCKEYEVTELLFCWTYRDVRTGERLSSVCRKLCKK